MKKKRNLLDKRVVVKNILKKSKQPVLVIKEHELAEYKSRFFKE